MQQFDNAFLHVRMKCGLYYFGQLADRITHDIKSFIFVPFLCCFLQTDAITSGRTIQCLSGDQLAEMLTFIFSGRSCRLWGNLGEEGSGRPGGTSFAKQQKMNLELYFVDRLCWE